MIKYLLLAAIAFTSCSRAISVEIADVPPQELNNMTLQNSRTGKTYNYTPPKVVIHAKAGDTVLVKKNGAEITLFVPEGRVKHYVVNTVPIRDTLKTGDIIQ